MQRDKNDLAVYLPTPPEVVKCMLDIADVGPGDTLCDLGFGDGRILFSAVRPPYNARAVGIELDTRRFNWVKARVRELGLERRIEVLHGDILDFDIGDATAVTVYLTPHGNRAVKPMLESQLESNARVVSHDYEFEGWEHTKIQLLTTYQRAETPIGYLEIGETHKIYLYKMDRIL